MTRVHDHDVCLFVCLLWHASGGLGTWTNVDNLRPGRSDLLWGLSLQLTELILKAFGGHAQRTDN